MKGDRPGGWGDGPPPSARPPGDVAGCLGCGFLLGCLGLLVVFVLGVLWIVAT